MALSHTVSHTLSYKFVCVQVGREDEFSINRQQMMARIWVCMGGQVAEELMFGRDQVTTGATDDLRQVCFCLYVNACVCECVVHVCMF
jgi:ATP-dependent Zn protease